MRPLCILVTGDPVPSAHEQRGNFVRLMQETVNSSYPGPWSVVDARTASEWPSPEALAGVIITGSPASVTDREPWVLEGQKFLLRVVDAGRPVLGVCFGHQMLTVALGGHVDKNPRGREIGTVELSLCAEDPVLSDPLRPYQVNMSHVDSVVEPPAGARVLGGTALDPHAALRFRDNAWGVQFHPEFDSEIVGHYANARADDLRREGLNPEQIGAAATDAPSGAGVLRRFAALVAGRELWAG